MNQLPEGCEIWATGASGKEWKTKAHRIEFRSPDGPTSIQFTEDGGVEITCYSMQALRFGAAGGIDNRIRLELKAPNNG